MTNPRPLLLLSNDDGHLSVGINTLFDALATIADVVMIAPESEQSASSHALSLHRPLRLREVSAGKFALDGTPADCVYVGLHAAGRPLARTPDLVVSGINHGVNLAQDVFYSGTVAAAREGALFGVPAIAASAHPQADFVRIAKLVTKVASNLLASKPRGRTLLSINVPKGWNGAVTSARLGSRNYEEHVDFRTDPRGKEYLWIGGPGVRHGNLPGTDTAAYDAGIASITPLVLDLTSEPDLASAGAIAAAVATAETHSPDGARSGDG